jgi:hypothetical protein
VHRPNQLETTLKIISYRPAPSGGGTIGFAEIEAAPGVRLFDVKIVRTNDGTIRAYARNTAFDRTAVAEIQKSLTGGACLERTAS